MSVAKEWNPGSPVSAMDFPAIVMGLGRSFDPDEFDEHEEAVNGSWSQVIPKSSRRPSFNTEQDLLTNAIMI